MLKHWISEARPRTLLLGLTNCAVGCGLGFFYGAVNLYNLIIAILIITTGVLLQIISNFANDYGDACKNADTSSRQGPIRGVMTGDITLVELRHAMAIVIVMAGVSGLLAVYMSLFNNIEVLAWFLFAGVASIVAAIFYTMGLAYGYKGLGDVSVFIFFGLVAVIGPQIMIASVSGGGIEIYPDTTLLGFSVGFGSVMVLHVANMRDIFEDRLTGKKTIAARLGPRFSAYCHLGLFILMALTSLAACFTSHKGWEMSILAVGLCPLLVSVIRVLKNASQSDKIAKELKYTLLGVSFHNVSWLVVLTVDFWFYF